MSSSFFNYIQPTIVHLGDDSEIPEALQNHYLVNLNIAGIKYFNDNYLLIQGVNGYEYMLTNIGEKIMISENIENIDIPRVYLCLSETLIKNDDAFRNWLISALRDNAIFYNGTEDFVPGVDYWLNDTLYNYLIENESQFCEPDLSKKLFDYLDGDYEITKYWQDIPEEVRYYTNFQYFYNKNYVYDHNTYSEDELDNLYSTFCKIILNETTLDNIITGTVNDIYYRTLNYYSAFKTDSTAVGINVILNSEFAPVTSYTTGCGCSTSTGTDIFSDYTNKSCSTKYDEAMFEYVKKMLSDVNFYKDWMYSENVDEIFPNEGMIKNLIQLLSEFEAADYDLSFSSSRPVYGCRCSDIQDTTDECNHKIIQNYIKVLTWVLNKQIDENTNKIKVYGQQFAGLLVKLQF